MELADAITAAEPGTPVTILKDITLSSTLDVSKNVTLDLNGHNIHGELVRAIKVCEGTLTLTGSGIVSSNVADVANSVIRVGGDAEANAGLVVGKDVTISTATAYGVAAFGTTTETVEINGTVTSTAPANNAYDGCAVSTVGSDSTAASITINDGAVISATNTNAIYMPSGNLTVNGGTITGRTGIYVKSGSTTVKGGTITGNGAAVEYNYYGNGGISTGDALVVDSCGYPRGVPSVSVTGGSFASTNAKAVASYNTEGNEAVTKFVSGGTFSSDPSAYVAERYKVTRLEDGKCQVVALFASGSGTEADPFLISSADQLKAFRDSVNAGTTYSDKYIQLTTDINLNNKEWLPIGEKEGDKFSGTFDGQNHKIEWLSITATPEIDNKATFDGYAGFFGAINGGTVKNLSVYGSVSGKNVAGVVARVDGNSSVENCHNHATVTSTNNAKAGGVICLTNAASITVQNCTNSGAVSGGNSGTAGIVGYANAGVTISDCSNFGNIGDESCRYSGGIVGYATGDNATGSITKCSNSGIIVAHEECGGIVGIITGSQNVSDCTNTQSVNGTDAAASGGIVGSFANGTIKNCTNTASVHGQFAGGVVGSAQKGVIDNCSGGTEAITSPAFTLGFTGQTFTLNVTENQAAGRILGTNQGSGSNNYTVLKLANNEDNQAIGTVGMCGNLTTWANLKISSGTFYGEPLAGNTTYITLEAGATWGNKAAGTYYCGGLTESSRIATWQIKN